MRGPAPKDPEQRRRRNKPPEFDYLPAEGHTGDYPPLPDRYRVADPEDGTPFLVDYLAETRHWYDVFARSPMATRFVEVDWMRLQQLAPLIDRYYRNPSQTLIAELRQQQAMFGGSPIDRQRLRLRIGEPGEPPAVPERPKARHDPRLRAVE
jgi:hypothetical protein